MNWQIKSIPAREILTEGELEQMRADLAELQAGMLERGNHELSLKEMFGRCSCGHLYSSHKIDVGEELTLTLCDECDCAYRGCMEPSPTSRSRPCMMQRDGHTSHSNGYSMWEKIKIPLMTLEKGQKVRIE